MSRHKNIGHIASSAYEVDDGQDLYENYEGDGYGDYGDYGGYGEEGEGEYDPYDKPTQISKKKKGKSTPAGALGGYEEDLDAGEPDDPDLAAALKASKEEAKKNAP